MIANDRWAPYLVPLFLAFWIYGKYSNFRFRKRAVEVSGKVLKVIPHSRFTSYFLAYDYDGKTRIAEYYGPPLIRRFEIGASVRVLIDGSAPPDVPLPGDTHLVWFGGNGGNCTLADDTSWISLADLVMFGGIAYLVGMGWLFHSAAR